MLAKDTCSDFALRFFRFLQLKYAIASVAALCCVFVCSTAAAHDIAKEMSDAANVFLQSLGDEDRKKVTFCLLYTSPSPRDKRQSRMPSSA